MRRPYVALTSLLLAIIAAGGASGISLAAEADGGSPTTSTSSASSSATPSATPSASSAQPPNPEPSSAPAPIAAPAQSPNLDAANLRFDRAASTLRELKSFLSELPQTRPTAPDELARYKAALARAILRYPRVDQDAPHASLKNLVRAAEAEYDDAEADIKRLRKTEAKVETSLNGRLASARKARCYTAYCWGGEDGTFYGIEPMLDLPIGTSFSLGGGGLSAFSNSSDISIQFTAGLRLWVLNDLLSLSMFFGKPVYTGRETVRLKGSDTEHPTSSIRRIGPSFALGFFGDVLFLGGGYDVLTNSPGSGRDPNYGSNEVLSRTITITIGIAPFTAARNVAGAFGGK